MAEAKKPQNLKIYILCTKGSLGPCVQPVLDAQTVFDTRHRNLLVEVYNNNGDLQDVVKYDAVFDKDKKIKARKEQLKYGSGQFLTAAEAIELWPDFEIVEVDADSFSLDRADDYLQKVNNHLAADYNPVTDNCQEFVDKLLFHARGSCGPLPTLGEQVWSQAFWIARYGTTVLVHILFLVLLALVFSLPVVYYVLPPGEIWFADILNVFHGVYEDAFGFFHYALWFYLFRNVALYICPLCAILCASYAPMVLIAKFFSCEGADIIQQWFGVTGFEGCWLGYFLSLYCVLQSVVLARFCELVITWVPPEVSVALNFIILMQMDDYGFGSFCAQSAASFADLLGRCLRPLVK